MFFQFVLSPQPSGRLPVMRMPFVAMIVFKGLAGNPKVGVDDDLRLRTGDTGQNQNKAQQTRLFIFAPALKTVCEGYALRKQ